MKSVHGDISRQSMGQDVITHITFNTVIIFLLDVSSPNTFNVISLS